MNSVKAGLCKYPEEYRYLLARFYQDGVDELGFFIGLNNSGNIEFKLPMKTRGNIVCV